MFEHVVMFNVVYGLVGKLMQVARINTSFRSWIVKVAIDKVGKALVACAKMKADSGCRARCLKRSSDVPTNARGTP
jgi:hypothetical protein